MTLLAQSLEGLLAKAGNRRVWNQWARHVRLDNPSIVDSGEGLGQLLVQIFLVLVVVGALIEKFDFEHVFHGQELVKLGRVEAVFVHELAEKVPDLVVKFVDFFGDCCLFRLYRAFQPGLNAVRTEVFVQLDVSRSQVHSQVL